MNLHNIGSERERLAYPSSATVSMSIEVDYTFEMADFLQSQRDVAENVSQSHPFEEKDLKEEDYSMIQLTRKS